MYSIGPKERRNNKRQVSKKRLGRISAWRVKFNEGLVVLSGHYGIQLIFLIFIINVFKNSFLWCIFICTVIWNNI